MAQNELYTYHEAGYNGFFRRTLNSNPVEVRLRGIGGARAYKSQEVNFDTQQTTGSLGDTFQAGRIHLKGPEGQIDIVDDEGQPVLRVGDQES